MNPSTLLPAIALLALTSLQSASNDTMSLDGDWRFGIAQADAGLFLKEPSGKIHLPGTMDDAGLGPLNTKAPTLEGPSRLRNYAGPAWYQRDIEIPTAWKGKDITLLLERCRWVTSVWLDERPLGSQESLIAPHHYDLGTGITPGKHRLTICVDNTVKLDMGRFVSALFGGTWGNMNGIIGRIELSARPPVHLDNVQVYPNAAKKTALVKVRIGNATGQAGSDTMSVGGKDVPVSWDASGGHAETEVSLPDAKLWDEFSPSLTELTVRLGDEERKVRFGMRDFAAKGTQFTLNGRPIFLRGTLECSVWPITGYPPTDPDSWRKIYGIMKAHGLNHIRFHSWCPPEAAFDAADEEGIIILAEGPQANVPVGENPTRDAFLEAELQRIIDTYGNHPSFCLMTIGNEFGGNAAKLGGLVDMLKQRDPRRLYSSSANRNKTENREFTVVSTGRGIKGSSTERTLAETVTENTNPVIGHEIGQWMYYPDFAEIPKWKGVMKLKNFGMIHDDLARKGQLALAPEYVAASGRFATLLYKEEIEVLLRTAGYGGFELLDLHDYPTQGTALVGPLDPFWESKGFVTPQTFHRYCAPTVPLLLMPKRTYTAGETFKAAVDLAHFGPTDLENVRVVWKIREGERQVASGVFSPAMVASPITVMAMDPSKLPTNNQAKVTNGVELPSGFKVPTGGLTRVGTIEVPLVDASHGDFLSCGFLSYGPVSTPGKLNVEVSVEGTQIANDWDIWVYPDHPAPQPPAGVVACSAWDEAAKALTRGEKVVYFANAAVTPFSMKGRFLPVFWSPVWFPTQKPNTMGLLCDPKHPLFASFPTEFHSDWQWFHLMNRSQLFKLDDTPSSYRPLVQVIDNFQRNHKLGAIFEGRVGKGSLLVCGIDLLAMRDDPAARQLLNSLYAYAGSPAFDPKQEFTEAELAKLFLPVFSNVTADSFLAPEKGPAFPPENAIDGDPSTVWQTSTNAPFPHGLVLELRKPQRVIGLNCLPLQTSLDSSKVMRNGWIKDYEVRISDDGTHWGEPLAKGSFSYDGDSKRIEFKSPQEIRFLKFSALGGFDPKSPVASLAEISLITKPSEPNNR